MIIRYKAGFGNQLFQYAFSKALETKYGIENVKGDFQYYTKLKQSIPDLLKLNVSITKASKSDVAKACLMNHEYSPHTLGYRASILFESLFNPKYYFEKNRAYVDPQLLLHYEYLDGYWQSWRYCDGLESILREDYSRIDQLSEDTENALDIVEHCESVFLGIRRGDYVARRREQSHYYCCDSKYYQNAIGAICNDVNSPTVFVFSNDTAWVKENINFGVKVNYLSDGFVLSDLDEFTIMSHCKHAIIPNSTFHWWAAWLIDNPQKVIIRPPLFFADHSPCDIFPPYWQSPLA